MTAAEVRHAVALLGFNPELSDEEEHARFWTTLNMVIPTLAQYAPVEKVIQIVHDPMRPTYYDEALSKPYLGEVTVDIPDAAAVYFEVIGTGEAELSRGGRTYHVSWSGLSSYRPHRFLVADILGEVGDVSIRFFGDLAYGVRYVCAWDELRSYDKDYLRPPQEWTPYDMAELLEDFGDFAPETVRYDYLRRWPDYRIASRSVIELRTEQRGVIEVRYRHRPKAADADHEDEPLDLEPTLHHLVPLLVAHYLWMDDEPAKAAQYKANYDEQLALWNARPGTAIHPRVINATGW